MHFLLSTVVKDVLKFKYGWCNVPLVYSILAQCAYLSVLCLAVYTMFWFEQL